MTETHVQKQASVASALLSQWRGGEVELWEYRRAHRGIVLRVSTERVSGCLLMYCGDVATYCGPLRWSGCDLDVQVAVHDITGDSVYHVTNRAVGFALVAEVIEVTRRQDTYPA